MLEKAKALKDKVPKVKNIAGRGKPVGDYMVALDIGTEFIKALVGRVIGDEVEIIGVGRSHQALSDMQAGAIADIAAVVANCDDALSAGERQAQVSARTAVIGIAGGFLKNTNPNIPFYS